MTPRFLLHGQHNVAVPAAGPVRITTGPAAVLAHLPYGTWIPPTSPPPANQALTQSDLAAHVFILSRSSAVTLPTS